MVSTCCGSNPSRVRASYPGSPRTWRCGSGTLFQPRVEIRGRAMKGGHQREQQYCKTGDCKREKQDRAVDFDFPRKPCQLRLEVQTSSEKFQTYDCQQHAEDAAEQREEKTFPEQLLH